jgi:hypothetical protein
MAPRGAIFTSSCQNQNRILTGVYKRIYTVANTVNSEIDLTVNFRRELSATLLPSDLPSD